MFLDFKKAFIFENTFLYGIRGRPLSLIDFCFKKPFTACFNTKSKEQTAPHWDRFLLAPLLLYVNDILNTAIYSIASAYAGANAFVTKSEDIPILEQLRNTNVHPIWMVLWQQDGFEYAKISFHEVVLCRYCRLSGLVRLTDWSRH